jgi:hypothetical protein
MGFTGGSHTKLLTPVILEVGGETDARDEGRGMIRNPRPNRKERKNNLSNNHIHIFT